MKIFSPPIFLSATVLSLCCFLGSPARAAAMTITATGVRVLEGNVGHTNAQFHISLSEAPMKEVRVAFTTQPYMATAGRDFVSTRGTLIFAPGVREQTVSVPIIGDTIYERDESFFLYLTATGYTVAQPAAACTILDDDPNPAPSSSGGSGKIIYSVANQNFQIWAMNADGSNQTCLTPEGGYNAEQDVSPDGSKIAYVVYDYASTTDDIWTMNADGSHKMRLTSGQGANNAPIWSPDGKRIAFRSTRGGDANLYTMNSNGTNPLQASAIPLRQTRQSQFSPTYNWSPDGRSLAFSAEQKVGADLFTATTDGKVTVRLTNDNVYDAFPTWTRDGSRVVFVSDRDAGAQLFSVDLSGSVFQKITFDSSRFVSSPSFSPDGTQIAFASQRANDAADIECMNSDGTKRHLVTKNNRDDSDPRWLPDGSRIVYSSYRTSNVMNGTNSVIYSVTPDTLNTKILSMRGDSYAARPAPGFVPAPATTSPKSPSASAS